MTDTQLFTLMFRLIQINGDLACDYLSLYCEIRQQMVGNLRRLTMLSKEMVPEEYSACQVLEFRGRA